MLRLSLRDKNELSGKAKEFLFLTFAESHGAGKLECGAFPQLEIGTKDRTLWLFLEQFEKKDNA